MEYNHINSKPYYSELVKKCPKEVLQMLADLAEYRREFEYSKAREDYLDNRSIFNFLLDSFYNTDNFHALLEIKLEVSKRKKDRRTKLTTSQGELE